MGLIEETMSDGTMVVARINKCLLALRLAFLLVLIGCSAADKYSFIQKGQTLDSSGHIVDFNQVPVLSDALAVNYASSVASIMRCKFQGARISRELSSTAQVALAAFAGAAAAFDYGATTITALSLSSAGIPQLQQIFDASVQVPVSHLESRSSRK